MTYNNKGSNGETELETSEPTAAAGQWYSVLTDVHERANWPNFELLFKNIHFLRLQEKSPFNSGNCNN